jgi:serine/threonine protein phosphatase PrpC
MKMTKDLANSGIDITFSGSTCSLVFVSGPHFWCANIGDSRSVSLIYMIDFDTIIK